MYTTEYKIMLKLTLDSSCFEAGSKELEELMKLCENENITVQISSITMQELVRAHPRKLKSIVEYLPLIDEIPIEMEDRKEFDEIANKALLIHSPTTDKRIIQRMLTNPDEFAKRTLQRENDFRDVDIFALHVMTKSDFFVTKDRRGFIKNGKKKAFETKFNTKIRELNQKFIEELKVWCNNVN